MRAAESHGHPEPLCRADHDVGTEVARGFQQHQCERVCRHGQKSTCLMSGPRHRAQVPDLPGAGGVPDQHSEALRQVFGAQIPHLKGDPDRLRARHQHGEGLWMQVRVNDERVALTHSVRQGHRFGSSRGLIEQTRVGDRQTCQLADQSLERQQPLQPALGDLRLIGGVGGVPGRVEQHVARDHRRRMRAVVAQADHRPAGMVAGGKLTQELMCGGFVHRGG